MDYIRGKIHCIAGKLQASTLWAQWDELLGVAFEDSTQLLARKKRQHSMDICLRGTKYLLGNNPVTESEQSCDDVNEGMNENE
jgi:hypothetical protein